MIRYFVKIISTTKYKLACIHKTNIPIKDGIEIENIDGGIFQYFVKFKPKKKCGKYTYLSTPKMNVHNCIKREIKPNIHDANNLDSKSRGKVGFAEKPSIKTMYAWRFAYKQARMSKWQQAACDRHRFKTRINALDKIISMVLSEKYRKSLQTEL